MSGSPTLDLFASRQFVPETHRMHGWHGPEPDKVTFIKARVGGPAGPVQTFKGRVAWCIASLLQAGNAGITSLENPAPRLSDYVFKARKAGLIIDTEEEGHGGPYKGHHGRYRLRTPIFVVQIGIAGDPA